MKELEQYHKITKTKLDWKEGEFCAALHPITNVWYRAKIKEEIGVKEVKVKLLTKGVTIYIYLLTSFLKLDRELG